MDGVAEALAQGDCLSGSDTGVTLENNVLNLQIHFLYLLTLLFWKCTCTKSQNALS